LTCINAKQHHNIYSLPETTWNTFHNVSLLILGIVIVIAIHAIFALKKGGGVCSLTIIYGYFINNMKKLKIIYIIIINIIKDKY